MKTKVTILIIMICSLWSANAQFTPFDGNRTTTANFGVFSSGAILEDGFNVGMKTTFSFTNGVYIAPEIFIFPELRGNDYFHMGVVQRLNLKL